MNECDHARKGEVEFVQSDLDADQRCGCFSQAYRVNQINKAHIQPLKMTHYSNKA